jgi:hypothetical protein
MHHLAALLGLTMGVALATLPSAPALPACPARLPG